MDLMQRVIEAVKSAFVERRIKEVGAWDGAASNYSTTEAYCDACLLDLNEAAGRDEKAQSHCKLPVREEGDASNVFVDKAVFAAAGGRGIGRLERPADVPEASWNAAVKRAANQLIDAYEQMDRVAPAGVWEAAGKEPPEEARALGTGALHEQLEGLLRAARPTGYPWIMDVFHSEQGMSVVFSDGGMLYSAPVNIDGDDVVSLGEIVQVKQEFTPVGRTVLRQQDDGHWRWFSRSAVAVLNRVGEIDSRELFDSFVEHVERTGEYPTRQFHHLMGEKWTTGQCDWLGREGNVLLTSGLYNDSTLAQQEIKARQADPDAWGDSIHFEPAGNGAMEVLEIAPGVSVPVYKRGRLIEITTCPEDVAASWFTSGIVQRGDSMDKRQFEGLVKLFMDDEDAAREWLEQNAGELNRQIEQAGLVARSTESDSDDTPAPNIVADDALVEAVVAQLQEAPVLRQNGEALATLQEQVTQLQTALDEALHAMGGRLEVLEQDDEAKRERYREDMPVRQTVVTYRPSVDRATGDNGDGNETHAQRAERTFSEKGIGVKTK